MEQKFKQATADWLQQQTGIAPDPDSISFDVIQEGYCDTCAYETAGIRFKATSNGKWHEFTLEYPYTPGRFVEEVARIAMEVYA